MISSVYNYLFNSLHQPARVLKTDLEMTRRLTVRQQKEIQNELDGSPLDDTPYCALLDFQDKVIDHLQFGTRMLYWSACQAHEGSVEIADQIELLKEHLVLPPEETNYGLTERQFEAFSLGWAELPPSEQKFFLVPNIAVEGSVLEAIVNQTTFKIFGLNAQPRRMLPSFGLMQLYLDVKFGAKALKLNPVIGESSLNDIHENALHDTRDIGLPFPHAPQPTFADFMVAPWYQYIIHDFYHAAIASAIKPEHRKLMGHLSDELSNLQVERRRAIEKELPSLGGKISRLISSYAEETENHTIGLIKFVLNDMEHIPYINGLHSDSADAFWESLIIQLKEIFSDEELYNHRKQHDVGRFPPLKQITKEKILHLFCQRLAETSVNGPPDKKFSRLIKRYEISRIEGNEKHAQIGKSPLFDQISAIWQLRQKSWEEVLPLRFRYPQWLIQDFGGKLKALPILKCSSATEIDPEEMTAPIMRGIDELGRLFVAFRSTVIYEDGIWRSTNPAYSLDWAGRNRLRQLIRSN